MDTAIFMMLLLLFGGFLLMMKQYFTGKLSRILIGGSILFDHYGELNETDVKRITAKFFFPQIGVLFLVWIAVFKLGIGSWISIALTLIGLVSVGFISFKMNKFVEVLLEEKKKDN